MVGNSLSDSQKPLLGHAEPCSPLAWLWFLPVCIAEMFRETNLSMIRSVVCQGQGGGCGLWYDPEVALGENQTLTCNQCFKGKECFNIFQKLLKMF